MQRPSVTCLLPYVVNTLKESSVCAFSRVQLFAIPWTAAHQAPLSMEFSRQEYWNRLPFPTPGDFPDLGIKPESLASLALAGSFFTTAPPGKPQGKHQPLFTPTMGEGSGTHYSSLAWKIPRTEEPGGLQSMGSHRVGHDWSDAAAAAAACLLWGFAETRFFGRKEGRREREGHR